MSLDEGHVEARVGELVERAKRALELDRASLVVATTTRGLEAEFGTLDADVFQLAIEQNSEAQCDWEGLDAIAGRAMMNASASIDRQYEALCRLSPKWLSPTISLVARRDWRLRVSAFRLTPARAR